MIFTICAALAAGMALATQPNAVLQKAQEGDAASQNAVGEWCYNGTNGMKRDYGQALQWWAKAAKQGDVKAVGNMGMCYRYGYGIDRDSLKATRLYLISIRDGNVSLMMMATKIKEKPINKRKLSCSPYSSTLNSTPSLRLPSA